TSVPPSTRSMSTRPASCIALTLPGSSGAGALVNVKPATLSGCLVWNASIASCTSCSVPAASITLMVTGPAAGLRLQPAAIASPTSRTQSLDCGMRVAMAHFLVEVSLQPVGALRQPVCQIDRDLARLVLVEPVVGDQAGEEAAVHPARNVVAPGDRQQRPRVVIEADRVVEPGGLGRSLAEVSHALGAIIEPPRRAEAEHRIVAGERRELARVARFVER